MMTKIFIDAEDVHVGSVVLYAKDTSDGFVYADEACTVTVDHDTLMGLCMKGLALVLYKNVYHRPVYFKSEDSVLTMTIATNIGASDSAILALTSKEPEVG